MYNATENFGYRVYHYAWLFGHAPHLERGLDRSQRERLLRKGALMVRETTDFDCGSRTGFWYLVRRLDDPWTPDRKTRRQIEHALDLYDIGPIDMARVRCRDGYDLVKDAFDNYPQKSAAPTYREFIRELDSLDGDYECWGCVERLTGRLVAFTLCRVMEGCVFYEVTRCRGEAKVRGHAMYGLVYMRDRHYLGERGMDYAVTSARSVTEHSQMPKFMTDKFSYRRAYCTMRVTYQGWLGAMVRALYPHRHRLGWIRPLAALLRQEAMARNEY